ncbi:MAG: indole-3-glycerol-phosphate synthase [Methanomicrobiales archaeon]|nr:indole-3-glycerol-phosphate synthase [Methanomicrobiales archaeon]NYT20321.1 indole-3-glycerol-phosphate synthase [Methanomicrobiales archaeon]
MILEQVIRATAGRVAVLPGNPGEFPEKREHHSLNAALGRRDGRNAIIAEIKCASPSRGSIREGIDPGILATGMTRAGCAALSVLTEPYFFNGRPEFIPAVRSEVTVPILRKDFIIDERQLAETRFLGADAVLLIAAVLGDDLPDMVAAAFAHGLEPLVEVHTADEVKAALRTTTRMIGINNRDLGTLAIDLSTTVRLAPLVRDAGLSVVSESGYLWPCDVRGLRHLADGFLIGSALMAARDPAKALEGFVFA